MTLRIVTDGPTPPRRTAGPEPLTRPGELAAHARLVVLALANHAEVTDDVERAHYTRAVIELDAALNRRALRGRR